MEKDLLAGFFTLGTGLGILYEVLERNPSIPKTILKGTVKANVGLIGLGTVFYGYRTFLDKIEKHT